AGGVHLLADDLGDLAEGPPGEGEVVVDTGAELADVPGAGEEDVGGALRVGGGLAGGGDEGGPPGVDDAAGGAVGRAGTIGAVLGFGGHGADIRRLGWGLT